MPQLHNETPSAQNKRLNVRVTKADREVLAAEYDADGCTSAATAVRRYELTSLTFGTQYALRAIAKQRVKHTAELANERALCGELIEALAALRLQALQSDLNDRANEWGWDALQLANAALKSAGKGL